MSFLRVTLRFKIAFYRLFLKTVAQLLNVGPKKCCYCQKNILAFLPYKGGTKCAPKVISFTHMVGSNLDSFGCPVCDSTDRERHLKLYLEAANILDPRIENILHFAPEHKLPPFIQSKTNSKQYIFGDLFPSNDKIQKVDITSMQFQPGSFDLVIVNHVLEHVPDDTQALKEIYRVLKPGGLAILQTPYSALITKTFEDFKIKSDEARLYFYGQEDHVRLYGEDLFDRIKSAGFISLVKRHEQLLGNINAEKYGLNQEEPFFLFQKPTV